MTDAERLRYGAFADLMDVSESRTPGDAPTSTAAGGGGGGGGLVGYRDARGQGWRYDQVLAQPGMSADVLWATGLDVSDVPALCAAGQAPTLARLGLHYTQLLEKGQRRSLFGATLPLDCARVGLTQQHWGALGVTQPADIGLSLAQWVALG